MPSLPTIDVADFTEDLGQLLEAARAKAEEWIGQRDTVVKQLADIHELR
jgi:hypothetical protein